MRYMPLQSRFISKNIPMKVGKSARGYFDRLKLFPKRFKKNMPIWQLLVTYFASGIFCFFTFAAVKNFFPHFIVYLTPLFVFIFINVGLLVAFSISNNFIDNLKQEQLVLTLPGSFSKTLSPSSVETASKSAPRSYYQVNRIMCPSCGKEVRNVLVEGNKLETNLRDRLV